VTNFSNICLILGELYQDYKEDKQFRDFIEFNDLGLPLAYFQREGLAQVSEDGQKYILETWEIFLKAVEVLDVGFESLEEVFECAKPRKD
jgi:hypothetical protein